VDYLIYSVSIVFVSGKMGIPILHFLICGIGFGPISFQCEEHLHVIPSDTMNFPRALQYTKRKS